MLAIDPRTALTTLADEAGDSLAALSRLLRRNPAYLQQYVKRGSPRILPEAERRLLADYFGVDESVLGAPPAQAPSVVAVPWLEVGASAGPGALAGTERRRRDVLLERSLLREAGVAAAAASIIDARGDSMAPGILDGEDLLVKRLTVEEGILVASSDNPVYPPRRVAARDADVRGQVKLLIRRPR